MEEMNCNKNNSKSSNLKFVMKMYDNQFISKFKCLSRHLDKILINIEWLIECLNKLEMKRVKCKTVIDPFITLYT